MPRLIAVELDRNTPPDLEAVRAALGKQFKGVTLDDHRRWQQQIRTITRSFALGGLAILLLVGAATTAIIVSATKSAMASNREIVEVLHFVGATDRFIAREFERHFLRLGVRAGIVGAIWAMFVFLAMPTVMELLGGGGVTIAEIRRLIGISSARCHGLFPARHRRPRHRRAVHADLAHRRLSHPEALTQHCPRATGKNCLRRRHPWVTSARRIG